MLLALNLSDGKTWSAVVAAVASYANAVIVEAIAKHLATRRSEVFFRYSGPPLAFVGWLLRPLTKPRVVSSRDLREAPTNGLTPGGAMEHVRQLQELVSTAQEDPAADIGAYKMIRAIGALKLKSVREIMTPRPDMATVSTEATLQDLVEVMVKSRHNRIPLYQGTMDHVVGLIYARDVLSVLAGATDDFDLVRLARPAHFIPETKMANEALSEFLARFIHFAIVVDEYGGVDGLVTLEDLLEEIVGEIEQENEPPETPIVTLNEQEAIVEGQVPLDEVNDVLGLNLEGQGFETLGGFVLHRLGKVPTPGESFESDGLAVEVLSLDGRRVRRVRVRKLPEEDEAASVG